MPPLAPRVRLPLTVLLAAIGCALGLLLGVLGPSIPAGPLADFFESLRTMQLSSEALLSLFLPALLFEAKHRGTNARVVTKQELSDYLYPHGEDRDSNVLEVLIGRLRRKLDPQGTRAPIETVRGRGYRFTLA